MLAIPLNYVFEGAKKAEATLDTGQYMEAMGKSWGISWIIQ